MSRAAQFDEDSSIFNRLTCSQHDESGASGVLRHTTMITIGALLLAGSAMSQSSPAASSSTPAQNQPVITCPSTGTERTQCPAEQQFTDHLGNVHDIDTRNDIQFHRAMIHFRGWLFSPKARYQVTVWTVMSTDQTTLYGFVGYQFHKRFNVYGGINTLSGTRSVMGSHPFWLANDRVMADEFFRPSFTGGVWVNGELFPSLWYDVAVANNLSQLGIAANQLDRGLGTGAIASEGTIFLGSGRGRCLFSIKAEA